MIQRFIERTLEKRDEGGFTLIELLIVIIILAILAAIVVFAVGTTGANSKYAACNSDAKTYETAMEAYKAQSPGGAYPVGVAAGSATYYTGSVATTSTAGITPAYGTALTQSFSYGGPWMRALPGTSHYTIVSDSNGVVYVIPTSAVQAGVIPNLFPTETVGQLVGHANVTDNNYLNFDGVNGFGNSGGGTPTGSPGAICSDSVAVQ